jgi:hypothetical protein
VRVKSVSVLVDRRSLSPTPALSPPSIEREAGIGNTKGTSREAEEGYVEGKKRKQKEQEKRTEPKMLSLYIRVEKTGDVHRKGSTMFCNAAYCHHP